GFHRLLAYTDGREIHAAAIRSERHHSKAWTAHFQDPLTHASASVARSRPAGFDPYQARIALTNSRALRATKSAAMPDRYSAEPSPRPAAPAASQAGTAETSTPPTASTGTSEGSTACNALSMRGPATSAGNSLSACAPAARAPNASPGVMNPGSDSRPACTVRAMTSGLLFGETIRRPPASRTE